MLFAKATKILDRIPSEVLVAVIRSNPPKVATGGEFRLPTNLCEFSELRRGKDGTYEAGRMLPINGRLLAVRKKRKHANWRRCRARSAR
jgi:hypothetical protein